MTRPSAAWAAPPSSWRAALAGLAAPAWRYYPRVDSTNDALWAWAEIGAVEGCFVVADAQTAGRGRHGRRWHTPPGRALALSVLARPFPDEAPHLGRYTAWAALAMAEALAGFGVAVALKWPNDLLLAGRKIGGVLVEVRWQATRPVAAVLGVGVNLRRGSAPPADQVAFPAGDVESLAGVRVPRPVLVARFWQAWARWRIRLAAPAFLQAWQRRLAYRGQVVEVRLGPTVHRGVLVGLAPDGGLVLRSRPGREVVLHRAGTLRPVA